MNIDIAYALPGAQTVHRIELESGATVADALHAVAGIPPFTELALEEHSVGVFGERVEVDRLLQDGDRVEIYRTLAVDPKEARRLRAGSKT
ncbi:MAG: RnfH family protein [Gammaproteobacteria bacterium]|nr:RnfH family protein [Gammaproteobacteria bacterium]